ncbi:MAG TPA: ATP-grasp domain-containing protein [Candidatus Saccharimonadales bacterium]|nr:ATP-grasp domain-containing protein [Candidatus Saccharimonadales bacterium]
MNHTTTNNVAILFGGQSSEHDATCRSFAYLYERITTVGLREDLIVTHIIYLDRTGQAVVSNYDPSKEAASYQTDGDHVSLFKAFELISDKSLFAYGVFYGQNGEDGRIQGLADFFSIRSNFGGLLSCALSISKYHLNQYVRGNFENISVPKTLHITDTKETEKLLNTFKGKEIVVKPNSLGSSIMTEKFLYSEETADAVADLISKILEFDTAALVQEYILGVEHSCACLEKDGEVLEMPAMRIETPNNFFGQKEKFIAGHSKEIIVEPKDETPQVAIARHAAHAMFTDLEFRNAVRFDFIINETGIYFLEANPLPGILKGSILPQMLRTKGWDVENLVAITFDNEQAQKKLKTDFSFEINV